MSAVSKNVPSASSAASTTARVASSSMRRPKLLQPRPATETSSGPSERFRIARGYRFAARGLLGGLPRRRDDGARPGRGVAGRDRRVRAPVRPAAVPRRRGRRRCGSIRRARRERLAHGGDVHGHVRPLDPARRRVDGLTGGGGAALDRARAPGRPLDRPRDGHGSRTLVEAARPRDDLHDERGLQPGRHARADDARARLLPPPPRRRLTHYAARSAPHPYLGEQTAPAPNRTGRGVACPSRNERKSVASSPQLAAARVGDTDPPPPRSRDPPRGIHPHVSSSTRSQLRCVIFSTASSSYARARSAATSRGSPVAPPSASGTTAPSKSDPNATWSTPMSPTR